MRVWPLKDIWSNLKKRGFYKLQMPQNSIMIKQCFFADMPYYIARNEDGIIGRAVVFVHGFTNDALLGISTAIELAERGFTALVPEAKWHGAVQPDNFEYLFSNENFLSSMWRVIKSTSLRISALTTDIQDKGLALSGNAGICGFSMGGYISYLMPIFDRRFCFSAPVSGSPYHYDKKAAEHFNIRDNAKNQINLELPEASQYITELSNVSWLIQHALDDETVSAEGSKRIVKLLKPNYQGRIGDLKAIFYPSGGHKYNEYMRYELVEWFAEKLKS